MPEGQERVMFALQPDSPVPLVPLSRRYATPSPSRGEGTKASHC
jgi:hypothetical protein